MSSESTSTPPVPRATAEGPFDSLAALRAEHLRLMRAVKAAQPTADFAKPVRRFLERARKTGVRIDGLVEREAAQGILDYWTASLFTLPHPEQPLAGPVDLDPFDVSAAPDLSDKPCPYKGLAAFREADAERFFGRGEATRALLEKVIQKSIVIVTGPSGSGKSSLVLAGLLPRVRESGDRGVLSVVVPGTDPLGALLQAVRPADADVQQWMAAEKPALARDPERFAEFAARAAGNRPALLVVDQFEELFTLGPDQPTREAFARAVMAVANSPGGRVVLTVREDYLGQALDLATTTPLATDPEVRFNPPPLSPRELRRVIEKPAESVGLKFEDGVVDELVKEVTGEPTALPLLQFALTRLWASRERNRITWEVYRRVGSPREALKRTADEVYNQLPEDLYRDVARRVFLELVQPAVGIEVVRRRVRRETLHRLASSVVVESVLDRFEAVGLVRRSPGVDAEDDRFEVAHEALTRNWPRLAGWLEEARRQSAMRLQLESTAHLWINSGKKSGYLLSGAALEEATRHRDSSPEVRALVEASEAAQSRWYEQALAIAAGVILLFAVLAVIAAKGWRDESVAAGHLQTKTDDLGRLTKDLSKANTELGQNNVKLDKINHRLQFSQESMRRQLRLQVVVTIVRALAEAGTASTPADQDLAVARLSGLALAVSEDQDTDKYLKAEGINPGRLADAARAAPGRGTTQGPGPLSTTALELGRSMRRAAFEDNDKPVLDRLTGLRAISYQIVQTCAEQTVATIGRSFEEARPYIREFWVQYWGEMGLVEDETVKRAMVAFGKQLDVIDQHLHNSVREKMTAARVPHASIEKVARKELYRQSSQDIATQLKVGGDNLWGNLTSNDKELPRLIAELRTRKNNLLQALKAELKEPIQSCGSVRGSR